MTQLQITPTNNTPFFPIASTLAAWTNDGGWIAETAPGLTSWGYLPYHLQDPGTNGMSDYGGIREVHLYKEVIAGAETWFLFYGAGDGTNTTAGEWRIQLAKSTDRGITWTKKGPISIGLSNGSGTAPVSRDMLYMEKRGGTYYMHAMKGEGTSTTSSRGRIPSVNYECDVWRLTDAGAGPDGTWAFTGTNFLVGSGIESTTVSMSCVVLADTYHMFYSQSGSSYNVSRATGPTPQGPWTKTGVAIFPVTADLIENPKVFFHPLLGQWVMLNNEDSTSAGVNADTQNAYYLSPSLTAWNRGTRVVFNHLSGLDGSNAIGIATPLMQPEGIPFITPDGYIAYTYDSFSLASSGADNNVGRRAIYSVLEPSLFRFRYAPATTHIVQDYIDHFTGTNGTAIHTYSSNWVATNEGLGSIQIQGNQCDMGTTQQACGAFNTTISTTTDPVIDALMDIGEMAGIGVLFRITDANNYMMLDISPASSVFGGTLYKCVAGSFTAIGSRVTLGTNPGTQVAVNITCAGSSIALTVNGISHTFTDDGTFTTVIGPCGLRQGDGANATRLVDDFTVSHWVTGGADTAKGLRIAESNSDFVAEFAVDQIDAPATGGFTAFDFRLQGSAITGYRLKSFTGGKLQLYKIVGGAETSLQAGGGTQQADYGEPVRIRVKAAGAQIDAYLNGEHQINCSSATDYSNGDHIGFFAYNNNLGVRRFYMYPSDTVTITGLTPGQTVALRAPGGPPIEVKTASGPTLTFTQTHWPAASLDIDGQDILIPGNIWGGATLAASPVGGSGAGPRIGSAMIRGCGA